MTNMLLTFVLLCNLVGLLVIVLVIFKVRKVYQDITSFITPAGDGQPSPAAKVGQAVADMIGRSAVASIKSTLMGNASGLVRSEKAIQGDIAEGIAEQTPIGAAALSAFPALRKTLRRNPQLLDLALSYLANRSAGGVGSTPTRAPAAPGGNGKTPSQFNLGL